MGIAITSQELDIKQKNLRRWRQDIIKLTQACEELDTKPQKQINWSENLANIEEDGKASPYYSVLFDESMNKILQKEQMDLSVRCWDVNRNKVMSTKYFNS